MKFRRPESLQIAAYVILSIISVCIITPFLLLIISSLTDENVILMYGYTFFPKQFSLGAYRYLYNARDIILNGYGITLAVTVIGTACAVVLTSLIAYPLSRKSLPGRFQLSFFVYFTMLFNGGLVPTYLSYTQLFGIKNTFWALLVPGLLMNGFNILIMRTYFSTNIPEAVIESAIVDGAGEYMTFFKIVLPLSYPILATIGLFSALAYWNDWYNGLIYITDYKLFSIQNILNRIMLEIQFLSLASESGSQLGDAATNIPTTTVRMAIAVLGFVPVFSAYPFFQNLFVKGITIGAVKG